MDEFKVLFEQIEEAENTVSESERAQLTVLGSQNASIVELMVAAQELADPEPTFFSRG
jgi:hypothetical protein